MAAEPGADFVFHTPDAGSSPQGFSGEAADMGVAVADFHLLPRLAQLFAAVIVEAGRRGVLGSQLEGYTEVRHG